MTKKRILLVSNGFYPEISPRSYRATELAKEFYRQGNEVTVITKFRDHDYRDLLSEFPITFKMWGRKVLPDFPLLRKKPFSFVSRGIKRTLSLLFEYPAIEEMFKVKKMLKKESGYDLMISFAIPYPVHWGVAWSRNESHRIADKWVADCGDPYMFARLDTFKKPFYFRFFEVNFCKNCDCISIPFKEMQSQFYKQFVSKIRIIPQGFSFSEIYLYEGQISNVKPVFIFAGAIIPGKRDLTLFLDFLSGINFDFLFIVYTNQKEWFAKYSSLLADKLVLKDYVERLSLIFEMSKADFLINVDTVFDKQSNTEAVPSKLIDYALAKRPILNLNSAYLNKEMIMEFLNGDYSKQRVIELSNYDIRKVSSQFLES